MENKNKMPVKVINFNQAYEPPVNDIDLGKGWIKWGKKNNYPINTFNLYNYTGSSTSKSIIDKKNLLVSGNGFSRIADPRLNEFVIKHDLEEEVKKASLDFEIINGIAFEVVWSNDGSTFTSVQHFPIHKLREGIPTDEIPYPHFWFSHDWENYTKAENNPIPIRTFNPLIKQGKQVIVMYDYNPLCEYYSIEPYSNSINWIELDYEISKFHLNQLKQGYAPSFMINFATGVPTEDEMDDVISDFQRKYQGAEGAGKALVTFSEGSEQAPNMQSFDLNDSDERFTMLMEQTEIQIARGHQVPLPMVITTPGKLSSTDERMELLEEFQLSYISPRQEKIERVLDMITKAVGFNEPLRLAKYGEDTTGEIVQPEATDKEAEARATLRGSVGGVQGIIQIQESVAAGNTDRSSAAALLELIYGFSPSDALRLLGDVQEGENPQQQTDGNES